MTFFKNPDSFLNRIFEKRSSAPASAPAWSNQKTSSVSGSVLKTDRSDQPSPSLSMSDRLIGIGLWSAPHLAAQLAYGGATGLSLRSEGRSSKSFSNLDEFIKDIVKANPDRAVNPQRVLFLGDAYAAMPEAFMPPDSKFKNSIILPNRLDPRFTPEGLSSGDLDIDLSKVKNFDPAGILHETGHIQAKNARFPRLSAANMKLLKHTQKFRTNPALALGWSTATGVGGASLDNEYAPYVGIGLGTLPYIPELADEALATSRAISNAAKMSRLGLAPKRFGLSVAKQLALPYATYLAAAAAPAATYLGMKHTRDARKELEQQQQS